MADTVTDTGTLTRVSPRAREKLSIEMLVRLQDAQAYVATAEAQLKRIAVQACDEASVRVVAAALGVSPTTVQKWKSEATGRQS